MSTCRLAALMLTLVVSIGGSVNADGEDAPAQVAPVEVFPLPANATIERYVVGEAAAVTAGGERLVYSNTLGTFGAAPGTNRLLADDISINAPNGCKLRRYEFPVVGKVVPTGTRGAYTVDFALFSNCPESVPPASRSGLIIPGTQYQAVIRDECLNALDEDGDATVNDGCAAVGPAETGAQCLDAIDDDGDGKVNDGCPVNGEAESDADASRLISFVAPADVQLQTNMWFGVKFSRNNAGLLVGAPALVGFSGDQWSFPGLGCNTNPGGFPEQPHASFNLEIYADSDCTASYPGYKNNNPSGSLFNPGTNIFLADDIQLSNASCNMIGYEVAVKGQGFYTFRMQNNCESGLIAGTEGNFSVFGTSNVKIARITIDPPIPLPQNFWFEAKVNNDVASVVISGQPPAIGSSADLLQTNINNMCNIVYPGDIGEGIYGAFHLAINCAGAAPIGACCNMVLLQCDGGSDNGRLCCPENADLLPYCHSDPTWDDAYPSCAPPGACNAVCREVPQMNCPWPWPQYTSSDQPQWIEAASCDSDPFPFPCGAAACCRPDQVCENLTLNECYAVPPMDGPRQWQRGRYCGADAQICPWVACLPRSGDCLTVHEGPGCAYPECCGDVCDADSYCCLVEWDRVCVELANRHCYLREYDECSSPISIFAARSVEADSVTVFSNVGATQNVLDPGYCCRTDAPGAQAPGTVWFKFVATDTSARLSTCGSHAELDSIFNVFAVGDPTTEETACASLSMIACSDNAEDCGGGTHGRICVQDLVPGQTYYVMVASKTAELRGVYQLDIRSPCFEEPIWNPNDCNENKLPDGCELGRGTAANCNRNDILDECDIASGRSFDCDDNAIPDDCDGLIETLTPLSPLPGGAFGTSVVMDGTWLVVGSGIESFESPKAVYPLHIFKRSPVRWKLAQTIDLTIPPTFVGMSDGWIAVTSERVDVAYLIRQDGELWIEMGAIQGPAIDPCPRSGYPLAIDGERIALSKGFCPFQPIETEELVFVFRRAGLNWVKEAQLVAPSGGFSSFGASVALSGNRLVVGEVDHYGESPTFAHVFRRDNETWAFETTLYPPDEEQPALFFGRSAALDNSMAIIGATHASWERIDYAGAAYVFSFDGTVWSYQAKLHASDASSFNLFGWSVGIAENTAVIGAVFAEGGGAAYTFHRQGTQWIELAKLSSPVEEYGRLFGYGVATDGSLVAVGSPGDDSVFFFQPPKADCNVNGIPDLCDIRDSTSADCNHDDVPDDCEALPPADYDFDGGVDLIDLAGFQRCFTGPGPVKVAPCCRVFDSEPDGDVDLVDFLAFRGAFSGP